MVLRRLALLLLAASAAAVAGIPNPRLNLGFGTGAVCGTACGGGTTLAITTPVINTCAVGTLCAQTLSVTGGTGTGYRFNKVSEVPNTDFWDNIGPAGTRTGTPQYAESEHVTYRVTDSGGNTATATFNFATVATGSLAIASPTKLTVAPLNGYYAYRFIASGGLPPYQWSGTVAQPCNLTFQGWLVCSGPTGTTSFSVTVTDNNGTQVTQSESFNTTSALQIGSVDPVDGILHLPPANAGNYYQTTVRGYAGNPPYTCSATGLPAWASLNVTTCTITGTPVVSGNVAPTITLTDAGRIQVSASALINVSSSATVSRPAYNSAASNGFFVLSGQLYDPNGHLFHVRGINALHYDHQTQCCLQYTGANAVRIWDANHDTSIYLSLANTYIGQGIFPILTQAYVPGSGVYTSADTSTADLDSVTAWWVSNESSFAPIMDKIAINIANEWNGPNTSGWASAYQTEIASMRAAGYTCPIIIDADDQGENLGALISNGAAIEASDPLHNTIFSWHGYRTIHNQEARIANVTKGNITQVVLESNAASPPFPNWVNGYYIYDSQGLTQLNGAQPANTNITGSAGSWTITLNVDSSGWAGSYVADSATIVLDTVDQGGEDVHYRRAGELIAASGLPIIMGEFGPGNHDTGSDNFTGFVADADFGQSVSGLEAYGVIGWIEWAWDDNNLPTDCGTSWANWWGLVLNSCAVPNYTPGTPAQLTAVGADVVPNPRYSLDALGSPATYLH